MNNGELKMENEYKWDQSQKLGGMFSGCIFA